MLTHVEIERVIDVLLEVPGKVAVLVVQRPYKHLRNTNDDVYCMKHCTQVPIATAIMLVVRNDRYGIVEFSSPPGRSIILVFSTTLM